MDPLILMVEPELDERAATATMSRAQRVYEEGARDISRVMRQQLTMGAEQGGRAVEEMADKARRAYLSMGDAAEKVAREERKLDAAREKGASNTEALARRVERARLDEVQAINRARDAYNEYDQAAQGAFQSSQAAASGFLTGLRGSLSGASAAGSQMAGGFAEGFASSTALMRLGSAGGPIGLAVAGVATLGVMAGKVFADNLAAGMDTLRMQDEIRAKIGVDEATMRGYGNAASKAWASGYGESQKDNLTSLQFGIQAGLIDRSASDRDLQQFASQLDTMKQLTGADAREIAAGTRNFVKTGLVDSYQEAFDLIAAGQQKGLNISNDLLDTAEEYGTTLHAVGLSGQDAFGLIAQMQAGGIRNTDVAADSLKELSINVADGSKLTKQAFEAMGLNADALTRKFSEGGPAAREAFGEVLDGLRGLDDPVQQQLVGLALYKTKWEDAKVAIQSADLKTAAQQFGDITGKTKEASDTLSAHSNQWDLLGRNIDTVINKFQTSLADTPLGKFLITDLPKSITSNLSDLFDPNTTLTFGSAADAAREQFEAAYRANQHQLGGDQFANAGEAQRAHRTGVSAAGVPIDGIPRVPMVPGADQTPAGSTSLPPAPVLPLRYTPTMGLPSGIANATTSLDEANHEVAEKQARVNQLRQSNLADERDRQNAENELAKAQQNQLKAEQSLTDARVNAAQQANKQLGKLSNDMNEFGNKLDADFGISKGLGGIVENFIKAAGNILAAPFLQALGMIEKANPNEGSGLIGIGAANGAFGPQYTPSAIAASQAARTGGGYPYGAPAGGAYPGDAALLSMVPKGIGQYDNVTKDLSKGLVDCASGVEDLVNILDGKSTAGGSLWTGNASSVLPGMGFQPGMGGPGDFRIGYNSGHMQATLPGGTNVNFGSTSAIQAGGLDGGAGAYDPSFTDHWFRPVAGTPIGAPAATSPDIYGPANTDPGLTNLSAPGWSGPGIPSTIMPGGGGQGPVFGANPQGPGIGASAGLGVPPGMAYPSHGGNSGNIAGGLPLDAAMAATSVADMMLPGAGAAAKIGIQLANRTIGYAAQNAGIAANGVMETFSIGDNPRGSIGSSWLGKLAGGLAGAAPALPNLAGGKKPPGPMTAAGGDPAKAGNVDNSQTNHITLQTPPNTSANTMSGMVAEQTRMHSSPGRQ